MDVIKKYIDRFTKDDVVLMGGAAAYLWIKKFMDKEIPINDIDIHVNTSRDHKRVVYQWLCLLDEYHEVDDISSITKLTPIKGTGLSYDIFINEIDKVPYDVIDGIPVETIESLILDHTSTIECLTEDIESSNMSDDEMTWMVEKRDRMTYRLSLLQEISSIL